MLSLVLLLLSASPAPAPATPEIPGTEAAAPTERLRPEEALADAGVDAPAEAAVAPVEQESPKASAAKAPARKFRAAAKLLPVPIEHSNPNPVSPPSVLPAALCEELRKPREAPAGIEAERIALEKLAAEIARARKAMKAEILRLEALTARPAAPEQLPDPQQVAALAKMLKAMKADEAADLVAKMSHGLAVELLRRMSPKSAAALISRLKPELAATLVASLATKPLQEGRP